MKGMWYNLNIKCKWDGNYIILLKDYFQSHKDIGVRKNLNV